MVNVVQCGGVRATEVMLATARRDILRICRSFGFGVAKTAFFVCNSFKNVIYNIVFTSVRLYCMFSKIQIMKETQGAKVIGRGEDYRGMDRLLL